MRSLYFYLLLLCFMGIAPWASGAHVKPVPHIIFKPTTVYPDPEPYGDFKTLIVPFKKVGNLIVIEAQVDTMYGNFILDTGAPGVVLNKTYFRDAPHIEEQDAAGINGSANGTFKTSIKHLSIFELNYDRLSADVCDLSRIENGRNIKILGLLGTRLFTKFAITVDVNQSVLFIHKLDDKGNIPAAERVFAHADITTPFKFLNNVVYLRGNVGAEKLWFAFDTGAESNLIDYNRNKKLAASMQILGRRKLTGVGGASFEVISGEFEKLNIGGHDFLKNKAVLTDLEKMGSAYGYTVDAMLGYDFYSRGIFTINFVKKQFEMYIYNRDNVQ
ncbi:aspartyl protease family protein [Mucilaginibacter myungsuensis]|uniref:Aspartyl protease family protein n=1 Tax=Mucilaginibacter myungsuensis TaxID=649104 RepID=A0A929PYP8_9SPHI|nr:aspartyl protease family protein [Mucilaginibacter myungsuensis]MBE9663680.1 aspartyl protease family protein [Mucilaginibacter myungsuensis]MDN3598996.1 aspartyl protease family protein [Mucilaginibacter myungsuensis]